MMKAPSHPKSISSESIAAEVAFGKGRGLRIGQGRGDYVPSTRVRRRFMPMNRYVRFGNRLFQVIIEEKPSTSANVAFVVVTRVK